MTREEELLQEAANTRQLGDTRLISLTGIQTLLTDDFLRAYSDFPTFDALQNALADLGFAVGDFATVEDWNRSRVSEVIAARSGFITFAKMLAVAQRWAEEDGQWTEGYLDSAHIWTNSGRRR